MWWAGQALQRRRQRQTMFLRSDERLGLCYRGMPELLFLEAPGLASSSLFFSFLPFFLALLRLHSGLPSWTTKKPT